MSVAGWERRLSEALRGVWKVRPAWTVTEQECCGPDCVGSLSWVEKLALEMSIVQREGGLSIKEWLHCHRSARWLEFWGKLYVSSGLMPLSMGNIAWLLST
jgi:hypothetical protein